jgi:fermentation-respiration switch protein FrsA (DUF1100 family)
MAYVIVSIVALLLLLCAYLRRLENKNLYFPTREMEQMPGDFGLEYEDVSLTTEDRVKINGWYFPSRDPKGVVLFFHGNGENISQRIDVAQFFLEHDFEVFLVDYRGYGKSRGRPSEQGLCNDAKASYDFLVNEKSKKSEHIIVYGFSLGGAVAIDLASRVDISLLIVQSSFTSTEDMGKRLYPNLPLGRFIKQRYDSILKIDKVNSPVLIIHSPEDEVIPFEHGRRLHDKALEPKAFIETSGGHCDTPHFTEQQHIQKLINFLDMHHRKQ